MQDNPILVEVTRGSLVESCHRGAVAIADADGRVLLGVGDIERPVYPRSAVKAMQALPLIESGAADAFRLGDKELAIACASHSGEEAHIDAVRSLLAKAGLDESQLACGAHWPIGERASRELMRAGKSPTAIHNNCSGKHAGFLCVACAMDAAPTHYVDAAHPVQRLVRATLEDVIGAVLSQDVCATDGCSAPTWAMPLVALARGFARFGTGLGLTPGRAKAAARLLEACAAQAWHVAGTGRFCTEVMQRFGARVFVKTGAEGVYCAALPEQGLGIALKCDDGAGRAAEVTLAATLARFLPKDTDRAALERFVRPTLSNWNGIAVGSIRPTDALTLY